MKMSAAEKQFYECPDPPYPAPPPYDRLHEQPKADEIWGDYMTPEEFKTEMEKINKGKYPGIYGASDLETKHRFADKLMCKVLSDLGYDEGVKVFENMPKWYA